ncbi:MAG: ABC transporter permease [Candidatus Marinimicrobia bacterium]|nr:ABC transporter permease [Candidatus Neomarinimicrobiota bacterium]
MVSLFVLMNCDADKSYQGTVPGFDGQSILIASGKSNTEAFLRKVEPTNTLKLNDFMALSGQNSFLGDWDVVQVVEHLEVSHGEKNIKLTLYGHTDHGQVAWGYKLLDGKFLTEADLEMSTDVIILGEHVAKTLFVDESPLSKSILIGSIAYRVTAVVAEGEKNLFGDNPGDVGIVPISNLLRKIAEIDYLRAGKIELLNDENMDLKLEIVDLSLRDRHHLKPDEPDDFELKALGL